MPALASRALRLALQARVASGKAVPTVPIASAHPIALEKEYNANVQKTVMAPTIAAFRPLLDALPGIFDEAIADRARMDYEPDQPRDVDGKFAAGNASSPVRGTVAAGPIAIKTPRPVAPAAPKPFTSALTPSDLAWAAKQEAEDKANKNARVAGEEREKAFRKPFEDALPEAEVQQRVAREVKAQDPGWGELMLSPKEIEADVRKKMADDAMAHVIRISRATGDERMANEAGIKNLSERKVIAAKTMGEGKGANDTKVVALDDGTKALFKPVSGETGDLRENVTAGTYYKREIAASRVAEQLGAGDLVPAVVPYELNGEKGSLQAWTAGTPLRTRNDDWKGDKVEFSREDSERMRVFDYVTGNSDRHEGNVVVSDSSKTMHDRPILIDNGLSFPVGAPERFIQPQGIAHRDDNEDDLYIKGLLPATHALIDGIDPVRLAKTLQASDIDLPSVRSTVHRVLQLQKNPNIIAHTDFASTSNEEQWEEHLKADKYPFFAATNKILHAAKT